MAGGTGGSAWKALKKFGKKATGQQIAGCCVADVIDDITKKWTGGGGGGLPPSEIVGGVLRGDGDGTFEEVDAKGGVGYIDKNENVHKIDPKFLEAGALVVKFTKNSETQYQSDKTCIDIYSAFKEDTPIYGYFETDDATNVYQIIACKKDSTNQHIIQFVSAVDVGTGSEKTKVLRILTSLTGSIQCKWIVSDYPLGGSVEKFVMDVTPTASNSWTTNVTRANIYKAFTEGKDIVCRVKGQNNDYYYQRLVVCEKHADGSYNIQFEGCYIESGHRYKLKLQDAVEPMITAILVADDTDGYGYLDKSGNVHKIDPKFIPDTVRVFKYSFVDNKYYENGTEVTKANFGTHLFEDLADKNVRVEIISNNFSGALQIRPTNIDITGGTTLFEGTDIHMVASEGYHLRKVYYKIESNGTVTSLDIL